MSAVPRTTLIVVRATAAFTVAAVVMGAVVCASESGFECGTWPGCSDGALLPSGPISGALFRNPWIEMVHRASAILAGPFALASAVLLWRRRDLPAWLKALPWVTVLGAIVAGYVGRGVVLGTPFPAWVPAADLAAALLAMTAALVASVALGRRRAPSLAHPAARWGTIGVGTLFVLHLVSLYAAGAGSYTRCLSWPVWELLAADAEAPLALQWLRFGLAAAALVALALAVRAALARGADSRADLRVPALTLAGLAASALALGLVILASGSTDLGVPYSILTVAVFVAGVVLAARASFAAEVTDAARPAAEARLG